MVGKKRASSKKKAIKAYTHDDKERVNNPPVGLVTAQTDAAPTSKGKKAGKKSYQYDPHIDPSLQWAGKAERMSFEVPTQSLHVHERVEAATILKAVKKVNGNGAQASLFAAPEQNPPLHKAVEFYQHRQGWSNRLIAGDSLLVMNSLLEKEGMAGKVQCVYMDPPYGIKYGSNFQAFTDKREVKDGRDEDLTREPETIRAFRDTWELGIHSYLAYMRDRLWLAREMLTESGSVFVQIGDENVHRMGLLMDDVFGAENRVTTITYASTSGSSAKTLPDVGNYLLWYAKDKKQIKYRQLYEPLTRAEVIDHFSSYAMVELADGTCRKLTKEERFDPDEHLPKGARIYKRTNLFSQGFSKTGRSKPYHYDGRIFSCGDTLHWRVSPKGLDRLAELNRLDAPGEQTSLQWKQYEDEVPGRRINNLWPVQMPENNKKYTVQTAPKPVQRCILMTTDPGDLVFDPTCGGGTTATVAEQWGRRWVTCDTSRVAITLAKQRLMTAVFDYYQLKDPKEGVGSGFEYKVVETVSAAILGYDEPKRITTLWDQPLRDTKKARVTGPFTVEAVPAARVKSVTEVMEEVTEYPSEGAAEPQSVGEGEEEFDADASIARGGETARQAEWRDELLSAGIRGKRGQRIAFSRIAAFPGRWLHADAETRVDEQEADDGGEGAEAGEATAPQRAVICFGPEYAPMEPRQVENALQEANTLQPRPSMLIFCAFQFDPEAAKYIDETHWPGMTLLKVQMNADLQTDDLRKKQRNSDSFWLIGQPDVEVKQIDEGEDRGKWRVEVRGFDYFNTKTGEPESGDEKRIAVWMLDTDYDGRSLYPRQVFFPMAGTKDGWSRLAKNLKAEIDPELIEAYRGTVSLPFEAGENKRIAVKIVDDRGIESLRVVEL